MSQRSTFEGVIETYTSKAILFHGWYWEAPIWLPRSQITLEEDSGISFVVHVKDWLCNKKGLLEFTPYSAEEIERMDG